MSTVSFGGQDGRGDVNEKIVAGIQFSLVMLS
jgi:hypothetical protein